MNINKQKLIEELDELDHWTQFAEHWFRCDAVYSLIRRQPPADQWIPCSERLPNRDEYLKDDGRFIVTDGNRSYQCIFDMYTGKFKRFAWNKLLEEDKFVIAWQPLPEPYKGG